MNVEKISSVTFNIYVANNVEASVNFIIINL